jgi:hypothetical protein
LFHIMSNSPKRLTRKEIKVNCDLYQAAIAQFRDLENIMERVSCCKKAALHHKAGAG